MGKLKQPIITLVIIMGVLMLTLGLGFRVGILSRDPDGLTRTLIDGNGSGEEGEIWMEDLLSPWSSPLGNINNEYFTGIIGIAFTFVLMLGIFRVITVFNKKKNASKSHFKHIKANEE
ncbi:MAG: hypothetical protein ACXABO_16565 [Promethearchaeota archaeon]